MGLLSDVNLLLKGYCGTTLDGFYYICPLSNPNYSPKQNLVLPGPFPKRGHFTASSCKGLLLLDDFDGNCLLWNPSSCEHKLLPPTSLEKRPAGAESFFISSGLGFDPKSEDYKVVRFLRNHFKDDYGYTYTEDEMPVADEEDRVRLQVELYSLESDSWKPIPHPPLAYPFYDSSAYIDGFHYWLASDNSDQMFVLSFYYADEKLSSFPLPEDFVLGEHYAHLLEFGGSLAAVVYPVDENDTPYHIWVRNGESWTKKNDIEPVPGVKLLLGFSKNGEQMFLAGSDHELLLYDRASKKLKDTGVCNDQPTIMQLIPYVESSVQLSGRSLAKNRKLHDLPDVEKR
ncbi:hypothetical protein PTKIN_Ptkin02bG0234200 [Pterospermum kingtungense]